MASNSNNGGVDFSGLLFIVFLVLKLTKVIDWSWWWITCPLWLNAVIIFLVLMIPITIEFIYNVTTYYIRKWKKKK